MSIHGDFRLYIGFLGLFGMFMNNSGTNYEVQMLDLANAVEDQITGSLNVALGK